MRRLRLNKRRETIIYSDETWAIAHDGHERTWVEKERATGTTKGGLRKPSCKGGRLIILHAGSKDGWIKGADPVFKSKKASGDYHDEMNLDTYIV